MRTIVWGAIGCGDVCERKSGPPLYQVPGCELAGVTRRDATKGKDFARRHDCRYFSSAAELLAAPEVEAVYIATHPDTHAEYTLQAAAVGKHVLVEKEMASDAGECTAMIDACARAGVVLGVAFYRRCYPSILRSQELLTSGAIGTIRELRINDEFPLAHRLDLAHFLCGGLSEVALRDETLPPGSHAARGPVLYARSHAGARCVMSVGWHESTMIETLVITGETGRITVADLKAGRLLREDRDGRTEEHLGGLPYTHTGLIDNFACHLRGTAPLACPGEEGRKSQVIEDVVSGLEPDGQPVAVDYA
ncbi:MAG: Gfo/Idh/MocA family protein [Planctomycetota bacterium]